MTSVRSDAAIETVGDVTAVLGEGPYWDAAQSVLLWVDIAAGLLHRTEVPSGETVTTELGEVSAVFPARGGGLLYAGGHRVVLREPVPGAHVSGSQGDYTERVVATAPADPALRFNDGCVDPAGRLWIGSMHIPETEPLGTLYRLDDIPGPGGAITPVERATVSNGIGWSPDGSLMYYADSPTRKLDVFDYDEATSTTSSRRVFADLHDFDGVPDGLTVDVDGYVWACMWNGGVIRRFAPDGDLDAVIQMPVLRPTSLAFGGPGMADLYVTSARINLSPEQRAAQPLAGRLFRLHPGPVGLPSTATQAVVPE